eukprot:Hpha_TRINITY_DN22806_c0_g1::TRINITY_DN22806_c0_g1_i1::g.84262::m.84262
MPCSAARSSGNDPSFPLCPPAPRCAKSRACANAARRSPSLNLKPRALWCRPNCSAASACAAPSSTKSASAPSALRRTRSPHSAGARWREESESCAARSKAVSSSPRGRAALGAGMSPTSSANIQIMYTRPSASYALPTPIAVASGRNALSLYSRSGSPSDTAQPCTTCCAPCCSPAHAYHPAAAFSEIAPTGRQYSRAVARRGPVAPGVLASAARLAITSAACCSPMHMRNARVGGARRRAVSASRCASAPWRSFTGLGQPSRRRRPSGSILATSLPTRSAHTAGSVLSSLADLTTSSSSRLGRSTGALRGDGTAPSPSSGHRPSTLPDNAIAPYCVGNENNKVQK